MEEGFEEKTRAIGFRPNQSGLWMVANVSGVKVEAVESPFGIHLTFTRFTSRTAAQFEVRALKTTTSRRMAQLIVENMEQSFPDLAVESAL